MSAGTTQDHLQHRLRGRLRRKPLLIGLSATTLGVAGLFYEMDAYLLGSLAVALGGVLSAVSEWLTRPTNHARGELSSPALDGDLERDRAGQTWLIPRPVATFTGRVSELARLKRQLARSSSSLAVVALHGTPGLGKTQLAMAYAERHRGDFELGWWINGSSRLWVVAGLAELAGQLGIRYDDQEQAARAAVVELGRRQRWLLIVDDAREQADLEGLIPNGCGQMIITSRNPAWNTVAVTYEVPSFAEAEAVKLLLAHSGDIDKEAAAAIATQMQGLPLAVAQAGTYCRSAAVTLSEYAKRFRISQARLLEEGSPRPYPVTIAVTVRLVLEQLRRTNTAATQLLQLLAFVGPTGVPHDLPAGALDALPSRLARTAEDPLVLDRVIQVLIKTSLVSPDRPGYVRMHSVVQDIVRADIDRRTSTSWKRLLLRLSSGGDTGNAWTAAGWVDAVGQVLLRALPNDTGDVRHWARYAELQPHLDAYAELAERHGGDQLILADICHRLASYLSDRGDYGASKKLYDKTISLRGAVLGREHSETLAPLYDLGLLLTRQGDYLRAAESLRLLHAAQRRTLGPHDPRTLGTQLRVAWALYELGELREAEQLAREVWDVRAANLDTDEIDVLRARSVLSAVLTETKLEEAWEHQAVVLPAFERIYDTDHLCRLTAWHNWARYRAEAGAYDEAKSELEKIVAITNEVHGPRHPFSLFAQHNLARTLWLQGADLDAAQARFEETLAAREEVIGPRHPKTLTTRHYLARVLAKQGNADAAEQHLRHVIDSRQLILGPSHPQTMLAIEDLEQLRMAGTMSVNGTDAARRLRPDIAGP